MNTAKLNKINKREKKYPKVKPIRPSIKFDPLITINKQKVTTKNLTKYFIKRMFLA